MTNIFVRNQNCFYYGSNKNVPFSTSFRVKKKYRKKISLLINFHGYQIYGSPGFIDYFLNNSDEESWVGFINNITEEDFNLFVAELNLICNEK